MASRSAVGSTPLLIMTCTSTTYENHTLMGVKRAPLSSTATYAGSPQAATVAHAPSTAASLAGIVKAYNQSLPAPACMRANMTAGVLRRVSHPRAQCSPGRQTRCTQTLCVACDTMSGTPSAPSRQHSSPHALRSAAGVWMTGTALPHSPHVLTVSAPAVNKLVGTEPAWESATGNIQPCCVHAKCAARARCGQQPWREGAQLKIICHLQQSVMLLWCALCCAAGN